MNKIKIITSVIIALSLSMVNGATVGLSKSTLERANSSANSYLNLNISSDEDVFGIQFEMTFNSNELNLVDPKPHVSFCPENYSRLRMNWGVAIIFWNRFFGKSLPWLIWRKEWVIVCGC